MNTSNPSTPISDKTFASIERMRTNVLEKARERGLQIEEKINNHFDELLRKEKRKIIGKEVKSAARQFQRRRKQTEVNARKEIMMQINGKAISPKKRKDGGRKSRTGRLRLKSGKRRPNDYDEMQRPVKGELRRTVESQRANGKVRRNSPNSS